MAPLWLVRSGEQPWRHASAFANGASREGECAGVICVKIGTYPPRMLRPPTQSRLCGELHASEREVGDAPNVFTLPPQLYLSAKRNSTPWPADFAQQVSIHFPEVQKSGSLRLSTAGAFGSRRGLFTCELTHIFRRYCCVLGNLRHTSSTPPALTAIITDVYIAIRIPPERLITA